MRKKNLLKAVIIGASFGFTAVYLNRLIDTPRREDEAWNEMTKQSALRLKQEMSVYVMTAGALGATPQEIRDGVQRRVEFIEIVEALMV